MEKTNMKKYNAFIYAALAVIAAAVLRQIGFRAEGVVERACVILRPSIYIVLFALWGISTRRSIIQPQVRRYLSAVSILMVFWVSVRTIKYLFTENPWAMRKLWYMYYIPMLFIPLLAVFIAMSLGKPESFRLPKWTRLLYIPTAVLSLAVLTNDMHQLVFVFPKDALVWINDYSYGSVYFLVIGWQIICGLTAIVIMLIKSRIPNSRRVLILPYFPVILAFVYGMLYVFKVPWLRTIAGDVTVVFCLFFTAALESCIYCGLIQTNTGYEKLFEIGNLGAQIVDEYYNVRYASSNAVKLSKDMMCSAEKGSVSLDRDTLLKSSRISGGYVLW